MTDRGKLPTEVFIPFAYKNLISYEDICRIMKVDKIKIVYFEQHKHAK